MFHLCISASVSLICGESISAERGSSREIKRRGMGFSFDSLLCCLTVFKTMCKYVLPVILFLKCNIYFYISCIGT